MCNAPVRPLVASLLDSTLLSPDAVGGPQAIRQTGASKPNGRIYRGRGSTDGIFGLIPFGP